MGGGGREEDNSRWPPWLRPLLSASFFVQCKLHAGVHRSDCNMYCLDCMNGALCSLCLTHHSHHRTIQIRRSSYHDVIRVSEIQKVMDIRGVQTYIINSARVVFLNERSQPRPGKGINNSCEVCERSLLDTFRFCSLGCKIVGTCDDAGMKKQKKKKNGRSAAEPLDSDESFSNSEKSTVEQSYTPSTPPQSAAGFRAGKRRKGIPHRAPFSSLMVDF